MRESRSISIKPKKSFAFVVDGECESWYIQMLKRNEKSISIDLKPEIPQKKKLVDQYKKVIELVAEEYDKVFWIVDLDVVLKETREATTGKTTPMEEFKGYCTALEKKKYRDKVTVIINNPCLEYWYLLHFEQTAAYYKTCGDVMKLLTKHLPGYSKARKFYTKQGNDIYTQLKPYLQKAIANAKRLGEFDFENPERGVAQMHLLFETEEIAKHIHC